MTIASRTLLESQKLLLCSMNCGVSRFHCLKVKQIPEPIWALEGFGLF